MPNYAPKDQPVLVPQGPGDPDPVYFGDDKNDRNCYAYALNYTLEKSLDPGYLAPAKAVNREAFGSMAEMTDDQFKTLCVADGLTYIGPAHAAAPASHYLIAAFRAQKQGGSLGDYHWLRQDSAMQWSHKQRLSFPSTHDLSEGIGAPILNAHTANMRAIVCDYRFVAYYAAPQAGLRDRSTSGRCLVATATLEAAGFDEECAQLVLLRWFRDTVVLADPLGRSQVEAYYAMAPQAVATIRGRPDAAAIFANLHQHFIQPAVQAVQTGDYPKARAIFTTALTEMLPRYQS